MTILYRIDNNGGLTVGDTATGAAVYAFATSPTATLAKTNLAKAVKRLCKVMKEGEWTRQDGAPAAKSIAISEAHLWRGLEDGKRDGSTGSFA